MSMVSKIPDHVHGVQKYEIMYMVSKNTRLCPWCPKMRDYVHGVQKYEIMYMVSKNTRLCTWYPKIRDYVHGVQKYEQPQKLLNLRSELLCGYR